MTLEDTAVRGIRFKLENVKLAVDSSVREMEAQLRQSIMLSPPTAHYNAAGTAFAPLRTTPQPHAAQCGACAA